MQSIILVVGEYELRLYKILQHSGTISGLLLLAYYFYRWFLSTPVYEIKNNRLSVRVQRVIIAVLLLLTCIVGFGVGIRSVAGSSGLRAFQVFVVQSVVGGMAGFSIGVIILGLILKAAQAYLTSD